MPRHDDAGIPDGAVLIRAIHPDWIIEESGTERLSSATFRDGQQEASCFIADEVGGIAGFCENILPRLSQEFGAELQVATVPVHHVRSSGLWIYRRPEEFDGNAAHVVICPSDEMSKSQYAKRAGGLAPLATRVTS